MLTKPKILFSSCGLTLCLCLTGCSGDPPEPTRTPTPIATAVPKATNTPDPHFSPLGGKPATEEEKQYHNLQKKAEGLVLSRSYEEAIPLLEQALEQQPDDIENSFYLLLSHGSLEVIPSKGSAAYPYAKKVVEIDPASKEAARARAYLIGAELNIPDDFKYGIDTFASRGGFVFDDETAYKLGADALLHLEIGSRLGRDGKSALWEAEIAPAEVPDTLLLKKGTEVAILSSSRYFYSLTSWRKPLPDNPPETDFDNTIFEINAMFVEVVSEDENKGKKGWVVNQMDRFLDKNRDDPYGTWIPDRFNLPREAERK
jgi:tetratricopeptide (TPR) repeat protein